jgi:hypothetical protein
LKSLPENHLGGKLDLTSSNICGIKSNDTSLFAEPMLLGDQVETSLLNEWLKEKATLEEWRGRFGIAATSKGVLNEDVLKESTALKETARNFNAPSRAFQEPSDEEIAKMVNLVEMTNVYQCTITSTADVDRIQNSGNNFWQVWFMLAEKWEEVTRKSVIWEAVLPLLFSKTEILEAMLGERVKNEMPGSKAPTVWSSIASLTTLIHETQSKINEVHALTGMMLSDINQDV